MIMGGPQTDRSGQIQSKANGGSAIAKPGTKDDSLDGLIKRMQGEIARALPRHLSPDRMARVVTTALRTTRDLDKCSAASFLGCVLQCAQLGLEPNTPMGHAYLIPRNDRHTGGKECTLIIGYQGYIDIAARAGVTVYAHAVREGDRFSYKLGLTPDVIHEPSEAADREDKRITHVYAVATTKDGRNIFQVLSAAQVEARRKRSAASRNGPWQTDYESMCLKTAVRALWRWMPKSVEVVNAEGVETAADLGRSQLPAMSSEVGDMLLSSGVAERSAIEAQGEESRIVDVDPEEPPPGALKTDAQNTGDAT